MTLVLVTDSWVTHDPLSGALLIASLTAFFTGILPYLMGWIILNWP